MDSGDVVIQEIVALFQGEVNPDAADQLAPAEACARVFTPKPCLGARSPPPLLPSLIHRKPLTRDGFWSSHQSLTGRHALRGAGRSDLIFPMAFAFTSVSRFRTRSSTRHRSHSLSTEIDAS